MNKQLERYLRITLIILDLFALNIIYVLFRVILRDRIPTVYFNAYLEFWVMSNALWLILSLIFRTYADTIILNFEYFTKRTLHTYFFWLIVILIYFFFTNAFEVSRLFIASTTLSFAVCLLVNRFLYLGIKNYFRKNKNLINKVIILGYNDTAKKLTTHFEENGISIQMIGYIENSENVHELLHYPVLSDIPDTIKIAKELNVQEIYSTITPEQNNFIYNLIYQSEKECIRFKIVPNLSFFIRKDVHIDYFGDLPVLSLRREPLEDVGNRFKKRFLDLVVSTFVIIFILSWMMPIIGILILLDSGFPIFFKQLRTGKNKRTFYCLKFRSMKPNKDSDLKQATKNDQRMTRIGKFIRKTSIDEFPQFINVFKGEMSLVGPRPHMIKHTDDYSRIVDDYMIRQFVKPGITGWAQINGYRGEIRKPEQIQARVNNDLWYLENWSFWLDIRILFQTVYKVFTGDKKAF